MLTLLLTPLGLGLIFPLEKNGIWKWESFPICRRPIFPNNTAPVSSANIRGCHFGPPQQYHIDTEEVSISSSFVCPVHHSPGNTATNPLRALLCVPATSTHDICKKFLMPWNHPFISQGSHASSAGAFGCSLVCVGRSLQRRQICSPPSGISPWEGEEKGLSSSSSLWMQLQEICGTSNLVLPLNPILN